MNPFRLPNGLMIHALDRSDAMGLYAEIFSDELYLKHGLVLRDGAVVLDVGANIGLFALYVLNKVKNARVVCVEPAPATFDLMKRNIAVNGFFADAVRSAVSNREGSATFTFYPNASSMSSLYADREEDERVTRQFMANKDARLLPYADRLLKSKFDAQTFECPLETISGLISRHELDTVDLLKLDVEKAEWEALEGISDEDWPRIQQIVVEVHDASGRVAAVQRLFEERGFRTSLDQDPLLKDTGIFTVYARRAAPGEA